MQKVSLKFIRVCGFAFKRLFILSSVLMWVLVRECCTNWKFNSVRDYKYITIQLTHELKVNPYRTNVENRVSS